MWCKRVALWDSKFEHLVLYSSISEAIRFMRLSRVSMYSFFFRRLSWAEICNHLFSMFHNIFLLLETTLCSLGQSFLYRSYEKVSSIDQSYICRYAYDEQEDSLCSLFFFWFFWGTFPPAWSRVIGREQGNPLRSMFSSPLLLGTRVR